VSRATSFPRVRQSAWVGRGFLSMMALCAVSCTPRGDASAVLYPETGSAARAVMQVIYAGEVSAFDQWVLRPSEYGTVVVDHQRNLIYVGGREGRLLAVGIDDGVPRWERNLGGAISGHPILHDQRLLLLGTDDGVLHAIDLETHEDLWTYTTDGVLRTRPKVLNGVVYFSNSQNRVFALDVRTGKWRWQYERPQPSGFTIYGRAGVSLKSGSDVMEGDVLYTGFDDGRVVALDTSSGEALAIADLSAVMEDEFSDVDTTPLLDEDADLVLVAAQSRGVQALDPETLDARWVAPMKGVSHVSHGIAGTYVAVSSLEGVVCLQNNGEERWRSRMNPGSLSKPTLVGETLFVAHSEDGLIALDARTGELLAAFDVGSGMTAPPTYDPEDRRLYATSNRGRLFVFRIDDDI